MIRLVELSNNNNRTEKEAYALADIWNESYKKNGTYLYQR